MIESLLDLIKFQQEPISESLEQCEVDPVICKNESLVDILDLAKKNINVFPYNAVKSCWFRLYANICIARATELLRKVDSAYPLDDAINNETLSCIVSNLDNGLIIAGGGDDVIKGIIHEILRRLDHILYTCKSDGSAENADDEESPLPLTKKPRLTRDAVERLTSPSSQLLPLNLAFVPKISHPVSRLDSPSLAKFESTIHKFNVPVVLTNTLTHWPALRTWNDANYWRRRTLTGLRLVPIEIGQSYTDEAWRQEIMTFGRFLEDFILQGDDAKEIGYLAQHDLFSQIPELRADIWVPDYCFADVPSTSRTNGESNSRVEENGLTDGASDLKTERGLKRKVAETDSVGITDDDPHTNHDSVRRARHDLRTNPTTRPSTTTLFKNGDQAEHVPTSTSNTQIDPVPPSPTSHSYPSPSPPPPPTIHQNIWFGTRTVTPLHHDPYSNILTQIHGTKYIRLYDPKHTANLYPRSSKEVAPHVPSSHDATQTDDAVEHLNTEGGNTTPTIDMSNTSTIPLWEIEQSPYEDWDELYPGFSDTPYAECLLREGEALYIPKGWWHYVRGVSAVGIGVSFWW